MALLPLAGWAVDDVAFNVTYFTQNLTVSLATVIDQADADDVTSVDKAKSAYLIYNAQDKPLPKPVQIDGDDIEAHVNQWFWYKATKNSNNEFVKASDALESIKDAGYYLCEFVVNVGNHAGNHSGVIEIAKRELKVTAKNLTGENALTFGDAFTGSTVEWSQWPKNPSTDLDVLTDQQKETLSTSFGTITYQADYTPFDKLTGNVDTHVGVIIPIITGLNSSNYSFKAVHGDLQVVKKSIAAAASLNAAIDNRFYNSKNDAPNFRIYDVANPTVALVAGEDFTVKYYSDAACTTEITTTGVAQEGIMHKGNYYVKITGDGNYKDTYVPTTVLTYKVQPELLIVTMKSESYDYKAAAYDFTDDDLYTVTGLGENDAIESYALTLQDNTSATVTTQVDVAANAVTNVAYKGNYTIKANTFAPVFTAASKCHAGDYTVQFSTTAITINPAPILIKLKQQIMHADEIAAITAGIQPNTTDLDPLNYANFMEVDAVKTTLGTDEITTYPKFKATKGSDDKYTIDLVRNAQGKTTAVVKTGGLEPVDITRNYTFVPAETAELIVIADMGILYVIPTDEVYGAITGEGYVKVTVVGGDPATDNDALAALLNDNKVTVKVFNDPTAPADPRNGKMVNVGSTAADFIEYPNAATYAVAYDEAVFETAEWQALAAKYDINLVGRPNYTIKKAPLNVTLKEQAIYTSEGVGALEINAKTVEFDAPVNGDTAEDLYAEMVAGAALATEAPEYTVAGAYPAQIILDGAFEFDNYEVAELTKGDLYVSVAGNVELEERDATDPFVPATLEEWDHYKKTVKITIKRDGAILNTEEADPAAAIVWEATWGAQKWNAMVLPFDVTPRDLVNAFNDYVVVNLVDADRTTTNNVQFQLWMDEIPANTPFLIKTSGAVASPTTLTFADKTIKYVETPSVDAGNGYTFEGNYAGITVDKDASYLRFLVGNREKWAQIGATSANAWDVTEFAAFVNLTQAAAGREVTFTMEEADGSTTTVKSINMENTINNANAEGWYTIDGMKLNAAPTQKGIYINNGKKIVVK